MEYLYKFRCEPVISPNEVIIAYEILTDIFSLSRKRFINFHELAPGLKNEIFEQQLSVVEKLISAFGEGIKLSLNVDVDCAINISRKNNLKNKIKKINHSLRLEINEYFSHSDVDGHAYLIDSLSEICPLWLDDFGAGNTCLPCLNISTFEVIKVDKNFFWSNDKNFDFLSNLVGGFNNKSGGVILEGVDSFYRDQLANRLSVRGKQGYLWPAVSTRELFNRHG